MGRAEAKAGSGFGAAKQDARSNKATSRGLPPLSTVASAQEGDRLLAEIVNLASPEAAALWAKNTMPTKNILIGADAGRIEQAFQARVKALQHEPEANNETAEKEAVTEFQPTDSGRGRTRRTLRSIKRSKIDKAALPFPEPRRIRSKEHLKFVARQPCVICGRTPCDPHHLRFAQHKALSRKVSDEFTVPLCRGHHRELHRCGDESGWWKKYGIDPKPLARSLWLKTHPINDGAGVARPEVSTDRNGTYHATSVTNRLFGKGKRDDETKPIAGAGVTQP